MKRFFIFFSVFFVFCFSAFPISLSLNADTSIYFTEDYSNDKKTIWLIMPGITYSDNKNNYGLNYGFIRSSDYNYGQASSQFVFLGSYYRELLCFEPAETVNFKFYVGEKNLFYSFAFSDFDKVSTLSAGLFLKGDMCGDFNRFNFHFQLSGTFYPLSYKQFAIKNTYIPENNEGVKLTDNALTYSELKSFITSPDFDVTITFLFEWKIN